MATVRIFTVTITSDDDGNVIDTQTDESSRPLITHEFTPNTVRIFTVTITSDGDGNVIDTQADESSRPLTTHEFTPKSRLYPRSCGQCDRVSEHPVHRIC